MADKATIEFAISINSLPRNALNSPLADLLMMRRVNNFTLITDYWPLDNSIILFINEGLDTLPNAKKIVLKLAIETFQAMLSCHKKFYSPTVSKIRQKIVFLEEMLKKTNE